MSNTESYYQILGIKRNANRDEIRKAYLFKANILHPDRLDGLSGNIRRKAEEELKKVNIAHDTLINPLRRNEYDLIIFGNSIINEENPKTKRESQSSYNLSEDDHAEPEDLNVKVARIVKYTILGGVIAVAFCAAIGMFVWGKAIYVQIVLAIGLIAGLTAAILMNARWKQ